MIEKRKEFEKYLKNRGMSQNNSKHIVKYIQREDAASIFNNILNENEQQLDKFLNVFNKLLNKIKNDYESKLEVKENLKKDEFLKQYYKLKSDQHFLNIEHSKLKLSHDKLLKDKNKINISKENEIVDLEEKLLNYQIEINRLKKELVYYKDICEKSKIITDSLGYVYLLKTDLNVGYRIGSTKNIEERKIFPTKVPFKYEFIKKWHCINYKTIEKKLHKIYNDKRYKGSEWFNIDDKDIKNIDIFFNENKLLINDNFKV